MEPSTPNVLFIDDDETASQALIRGIERRNGGFNCLHAATAQHALELLSQHSPAVVVVDLSLDPSVGPESGFELISEMLSAESAPRVIVLTGHGSDEYGIKALQRGAASFVRKPAEPDHLFALLQDALALSELKQRYRSLATEPEHLSNVTGLSTRNAEMQHVIESVAYAATTMQPVLLIGETGVGKGVIAQAIHKASAARGPFIRFQAIFGNADLTSSELFGHTKGAFTGATENKSGLIEEANNGTLFLDELDELPQETQITLLNVIQEKVFRRLGETKERQSNFRLIAATNRALDECLEQGKLRQDFYHRIAHLTIDIPPLRKRPEDIPMLAEQFVATIANRENLLVQGLNDQALAKLTRYPWPGNIRELQAKVEGGVYRTSFAKRRFIEPVDLDLDEKRSGIGVEQDSFRKRVQDFELRLVREALQKNDDNQTKAAESLQLDRTSLRRILERAK